MHALQLAAEVLREKSSKMRDKKMDKFMHAILHTKEGRNIRQRVIAKLARMLPSAEESGCAF